MTNYAAIMLEWRPHRPTARTWIGSYPAMSWEHETSDEASGGPSYTWDYHQHSTERNRTITPTLAAINAILKQSYQKSITNALYGTGKGNPQGLAGLLTTQSLTNPVSRSTVPPHPVPPARPATQPGTPTP